MRVKTVKTIIGDVYNVSIETGEWSQGDVDLMTRFGEPSLDLGGTFTTASLVDFSLAAELRKLKNESPFTQGFDVDDNADAEERANAWATEIASRISTAVLALRANTDEFTGEAVVTI